MTPSRPIELATASKQIADAWTKRDGYIERGDRVGVIAMDSAISILEERFNSLYQQWQILGGTSNIDSITYPEPAIDYEHAALLDEQATRESVRPF